MLNKRQLSYQNGWANYNTTVSKFFSYYGVKVGYVSKKIAHLFFENCVGAKANNDTPYCLPCHC